MSIDIFSYSSDIANDAGLLLNEDDALTTTTKPIRVLRQIAGYFCRDGSDASTKQPFLCFDLVYIYSSSTNGYRLSEDIQIHICKKFQQFEVTWSLGLAFKLL